ncbi:MAG TPA: hypothetical protein VGB26_12195 [Nitrospiria bacterium]|jgi:hypothetical protein
MQTLREELECEPYDPTWLVELAKKQLRDEPWIAEALKKCTWCFKSKNHIYFINPENPNEPGSAFQHEKCISLISPTEGWLLLDILEGNHVGAVEFAEKKK